MKGLFGVSECKPDIGLSNLISDIVIYNIQVYDISLFIKFIIPDVLFYGG